MMVIVEEVALSTKCTGVLITGGSFDQIIGGAVELWSQVDCHQLEL